MAIFNCGYASAKPPSTTGTVLGIIGTIAVVCFGACFRLQATEQRQADARQVAFRQAEDARNAQQAEDRRFAEMRRAREEAADAAAAEQVARQRAAAQAAHMALLRQLGQQADAQQAAAANEGFEPAYAAPSAPAQGWSPSAAPTWQTTGTGNRYVPDMSKPVYVHGYTKSNGTYVQPHTRAAPHR